MAFAPNSLNSGLNRTVKQGGILRHQPGRDFQLVFLISNNLGGNTTDGNAGASENCDPAPNVEIVESDEGVDDLIPKEIAEKVSRWLQRNNVPQKYFAEKVLNRSQGSFSDYLTKAPSTMPKSHGRGIWQRLHQFIESDDEKKELREQFREGKLN